MKNYIFYTLIFIMMSTPLANAKWNYESGIVGIDELTQHFASTARVVSKTLDTPYRGKDKATLIINNNPDEGEIKISIFHWKGNSICGEPEIICRIKFDNEPSFPINFKSNTNKILSILEVESSDTEKVLEKMFNHSKLKIEIKYLIDPPIYLEFNIADLDRSKFPLRQVDSDKSKRYTGEIDLILERKDFERKAREAEKEIERKAQDAIEKKIMDETGISIDTCKRWPDNAILKLDSKIGKIPSSSPIPIYPRMSQRENQQGTAIVKFVVTSTGDTENHEIISSSGHKRLDDAALDAIKLWKFVPAVAEGKKLNCWALQRFSFSLN